MRIQSAVHPKTNDAMSVNLPALVSFPRSGSQWLGAVMELYFDRPCVRDRKATLIENDREDWMWIHDHDLELEFFNDDSIYLYRNPIDVLYSWLHYKFDATRRKSIWGKFVQRHEKIITEAEVISQSELLKKHLHKWLASEHKARTVVRYESLKQAPEKEFGKICQHFGQTSSQEQIKKAFEEASREKLMEVSVKKVALGPKLNSKAYSDDREKFREDYGEKINSIVAAYIPHILGG